MKRLVVVGGGISGLAAAHRAAKLGQARGIAIEVLVLEREPAVGGKVLTVRDGDFLIEAGPTGYLDNEESVDRLLESSGMIAEKTPAEAAAAHRFLVHRGVVREVHAHPLRFARSGLLSLSGMLRMGCEPFIPRRTDPSEESVWSFAARRVGHQAADRLISPMMLGIFAGDSKKLSLPAAFPKLAFLEKEYGGLVRGMMARRREKGAGGPAGPSGVLTSFKNGLQTLPRALARTPGISVRCGATVTAIHRPPIGGWSVSVAGDGEPIPCEAVILTGEPWATARVVRDLSSTIANQLEGIFCPPVAVVALGYGEAALSAMPRGFGVLIPRTEGLRILGVLWDTFLFPGRSPEKRLLLRAMLGGGVDPEIGEWDEDRITNLAADETGRLLGLPEPPDYRRCWLWKRAIPQYELGHIGRIAAIETELAQLPGLFLAGNGLYGVAFAKATARGLLVAEQAVSFLGYH